MDEKLQTQFRDELERKYQLRAFEAFGMYEYWMSRLKVLDEEIRKAVENEERILAEIRKISNLPDYHSVKNRAKIKEFEIEAEGFRNRKKELQKGIKNISDNMQRWHQEIGEAAGIADIYAKLKFNSPAQAAEVREKRKAEAKT